LTQENIWIQSFELYKKFLEDNMLEFVARVFRAWMNVLLWLILIGCAIGGAILAGIALGGRGFSAGYAFLGLIVGALIGLITVILSGGLIANFLDMADNIKIIASQTKTSSGGNSSGTKIRDISPLERSNGNSGETWVCKKCNERNPITSLSCKNCGAYK
jgi:hypothetical protein